MSGTLSATTPVPDAVSPSPAAEQALLASAEAYLARGVALKRWWDEGGASAPSSRKFTLTRTFNQPDASFGFFGEAPVEGRRMPVMGNFQTLLYDRPKSPQLDLERAAQWMRDQIREFVLHYFMRISSFALPQDVTDRGRSEPPLFLRPFSLCSGGSAQRQGFGFSQLYYKRRHTGEIGAFPPGQRSAIVDLRRIGADFEWIILYVELFGFEITYMPLGSDGPRLTLPLPEGSYLIVSRDFVLHQENPEPGVLGRYGFGYAFLKNPTPGLLAYGPGEFDAAFETIDFQVLANGRVQLDMAFVVNRPERILSLSLNPLQWGLQLADWMSLGTATRFLPAFGPAVSGLASGDPVFSFIALANLMTGGLAARELCISRIQLEKSFLATHFMQHYTMATGSLLTWRQIPDWLAPESELPRWVVTGVIL
ncbi:MAG: hypothetical protein QOF89_5558 [Acidobacteriota bacterium]|jgi:hypothetical protein|nr:hypothetical protein [Acidobacteriota bacterium]